ncbi:MAG: hypothetical protein LBN38_05525 [Verrucomicrobiota bacterium]|jgi:hypothetical protein|nr:hypothetical protein [Verrucomicrobiota bacterium]
MVQDYGVYPLLERVVVPLEAGDLPVPPFVDCFIHDAEERAEMYGASAGNGRFLPGDYRYAFQLLQWLLRSRMRKKGDAFLEWGSGQGMVTILATILGYTALGVEVDENLVMESRLLAARYDTLAKFEHGTYDERVPDLDVFTAENQDVVYVYPWPGEEAFFLQLFEETAPAGAYLMMCLGPEDIRLYRKEKE